MERSNYEVITDDHVGFRKFTQARIALGRTGCSIPLKEMLAFRLSHAHAKDAVFSELDPHIQIRLNDFELGTLSLESRVRDKQTYLQRPDLGRELDQMSMITLNRFAADEYDVAIVITDGLSAIAVNRHIIPLMEALIPEMKMMGLQIAPLCLVTHGRVAVADEVGECLRAKLTLILIGERPGLSSSDSLGAYLTYSPRKGLTDESRNCISNIRKEGLSYGAAAEKILYLMNEALTRKVSGVDLKDHSMLISGQERIGDEI